MNMKKIVTPIKQDWLQLTQRPAAGTSELKNIVNQIFDEIKKDGDEAVKKYTRLYDIHPFI